MRFCSGNVCWPPTAACVFSAPIGTLTLSAESRSADLQGTQAHTVADWFCTFREENPLHRKSPLFVPPPSSRGDTSTNSPRKLAGKSPTISCDAAGSKIPSIALIEPSQFDGYFVRQSRNEVEGKKSQGKKKFSHRDV